MWFQLALNASVPPVQVLIGVDGNLYFRLWDLLQLLQIKNVTKYSHVFPCKNVLPTHRPYPRIVQNIRVVDIEGLFFFCMKIWLEICFKGPHHWHAHPFWAGKFLGKICVRPPWLSLCKKFGGFSPSGLLFKLDVKNFSREVKSLKPIQAKAPIPTDYPSERIFDSTESNPHNVSQPVIETIVPMEDCQPDETCRTIESDETYSPEHTYSVKRTFLPVEPVATCNFSVPKEPDESCSFLVPKESDETICNIPMVISAPVGN
ncbi:hypothetical protein TNIN_385891 [Trichonephila inaurata madagascariensis]|uniref:Uncharacterized protein n=1 Tax=Trichonephila inaurata madagascariensis TaxID=2747483 RepID=A0A8X6XU01_9ARAC|nr:hypothetical protein TNIN_385891 [Trichonephila inaurata madagascariensis]